MAGEPRDDGLRRRDIAWPAVVVGILTLAIDVRALLPGVSVWDTAEFQAIGPVLGIAHPTGYPSYTLLAWFASVVLQPFGDPAFRANLLSAILAAVATGVTAAIVTALTRRPVIGLVSGIALALAPVAWRIGLRADAHALHFALVAVLLALLVGWAAATRRGDERAGRWLIASAFVFALSLGNHALTLLLAPGIALFVLLVSPRILLERPRLVLACVAVLALTTVALYAYIPIRSAMDPPLDYADPETWDRFRYLVFGEQFRGTFDEPPLAQGLRIVRDELVADLGLLVILAALGAAVTAVRRFPLFVLTAIWFVISFDFAVGYLNADIRRYYLVPVLVAAVWIGLGLEALWDWAVAAWRRWTAAPQSGRAVSRFLPLAAAAVLLAPTAADIPARFAEVDSSGERWARDWLDAAMGAFPPDAVVVSWWGFSTPLWYGQFVEGSRPDILIIDDRTILDQQLGSARDVIERYRGQRPVILIRPDDQIDELGEEYRLERLDGVPAFAPAYEVVGGPAEATGEPHDEPHV